MCFDHNARLSIPPTAGTVLAGGATPARDLTLTASDGAQVMAYAARAAQPTGAGTIVLPDVRGLHPYYKDLARRFAEHGIDSIAIDYFARTAPNAARGGRFAYMPHVEHTTAEGLRADIAAAVAYLRSLGGGGVRALFSVGFSFGGVLSFMQAASDLGYAGVVGFYGWPLGVARWPERPRPIDAVDRFRCPVLALYGGADRGIPASARQQFEQALTKAGVPHESVTYAGAPHGFFDRQQARYADAAAAAWQRVRDFITANTPASER
ncbi:MAG: dienelactone hydrolase family protein [Chloroflexi bacterium]|nr:dienelactone hydrolase family protein [Chloroflexota bacterium]